MKSAFRHELKRAFAADFAAAKVSGDYLKFPQGIRRYKRRLALAFRAQVNQHLKLLEKQGASDERIKAYLKAARKMHSAYFGSAEAKEK
jgi:hypothetical protein